jgi:hypothetical protein
MHTHSPNKPNKFKQTLSACRKADGNSFLGQERSSDGRIHVKRDHNVTSVLWNTKTFIGPFRTKGVEYWHPVQCFSITMAVHIWVQLLAHDHCYSISIWSSLTIVLTTLTSLRATSTCLPTWRTGWGHSASTETRSFWKVSKRGSAHRR